MEKTFDFLKKRTQVNFVSTINDGKPSCRPFGDPVLLQDICINEREKECS